MTREQFRNLNNKGFIFISRCGFIPELPSDTDPTQNVPVKRIYDAMLTGQPIAVPQNKMVFNNLHADQMTTIDRRGTDKFDTFSEQRKLQGSLNEKIKKLPNQLKQINNNENKEN